jgi:hypothetical protein
MLFPGKLGVFSLLREVFRKEDDSQERKINYDP